MKLTEKAIAGLTLPDGVNERLFGDDEVTGLSLRLRRGANGVARSWVYRYMVAGTPRKVTFDFAGHNLAEIRKRAGDLQARVRLGADPAQERARRGRMSNAPSRRRYRTIWRRSGCGCARILTLRLSGIY